MELENVESTKTLKEVELNEGDFVISTKKFGKIYFSTKPKNLNLGYKVEDPWEKVNPFFGLKLEKFGFVKLSQDVETKLLDKKFVPPTMVDEEYRFAVTSNRNFNMEFHISSIKEILDSGKNVWIHSNLLKDFMPYITQFEETEIYIEDKYRFSLPESLTPKSVSGLLGLTGKFYSQQLNKLEAVKIGVLQDKLAAGEMVEIELLEVNSILNKLAKEVNLPPANIINKSIEGIDLLLKKYFK